MASKKRPVKPEDFYLLRMVSDPQLSPDGKRVAYTVSWPDRESDEGRMAVYVASVEGRSEPRRFTQGKRDHSPRWSPDGRYLAFVSNREERKNQIFVAPLDGGEPRRITNAKFGVSSPAWSPDCRRIAYVARTGNYKEPRERKGAERAAPRVIRDLRYRLDGIGYFDERRMHIFTVDVETGESQQITDGDWNDDHPSWSPDGRSIAFISDRERERFQRHWRTDVYVVPSTGGRARKVTRSRGGASYPRFSPDGQSIAYIGHEHGEAGSAKHAHLLVVPASGARAPHSLSAPIDRSVTGHPLAAGPVLVWSRDGRSVLFLAGDGGTISVYRAGAANGSVSRLLGGDRQIDAFSVTPDGKTAVFTAAWTPDPPDVYAQRLSGWGRPRRISDANDDLRNTVQFSPLKRISYKAKDGLDLETLVLYPPDYRASRRYPVALQIHGGPHGMHPMGFQLSFQALAAAGYVVLLPNPRGSQSYGEAFAHACVGDWGGRDFEDLMGAVDLLVERRVADPERLCVGGYSYGGFMTSWAVTQTDRFRAAVVGAPVADHISMFGTTDIPLFSIYEHGGDPWEMPQALRERSPATHLPNINTPVLLLHWEGDLRCPIGQSEELFQGLKMLGKQVEFVRYPGGSHTIRTASQAVDQMERTRAWFDRHTSRAPSRRRHGARGTSHGGARTKARA